LGLDLNATPNPFNPTTTIRYQIPEAGNVSLKVYDTEGRLVSTLAGFGESDLQAAGVHEVTFDGSKLASGVYLYRLTAGENSATGKMLLLK
jgi:flagellar hook assembly protein FlgD